MNKDEIRKIGMPLREILPYLSDQCGWVVPQPRIAYMLHELKITIDMKVDESRKRALQASNPGKLNPNSQYVSSFIVNRIKALRININGIEALEKRLQEIVKEQNQVTEPGKVKLSPDVEAVMDFEKIQAMVKRNAELQTENKQYEQQAKDASAKLREMTERYESLKVKYQNMNDRNLELKQTNATLMKEKQELITDKMARDRFTEKDMKESAKALQIVKLIKELIA